MGCTHYSSRPAQETAHHRPRASTSEIKDETLKETLRCSRATHNCSWCDGWGHRNAAALHRGGGPRPNRHSFIKAALGAIDFFCYHDSHGERLRFILARDEAGKLHSVLDTCRQCGAFHKGYTASKDELICRLCGNRYKLNQIEAGKASCIPVGLATTQRNGVVEIKVSDLEQARPAFQALYEKRRLPCCWRSA